MTSVALPWIHPPMLGAAAKRRDAHIATEDRKQAGRLCLETRRVEMSQRKIRAAVAPPLADEGTAVLAKARAAMRGRR